MEQHKRELLISFGHMASLCGGRKNRFLLRTVDFRRTNNKKLQGVLLFFVYVSDMSTYRALTETVR